MKSGKLNFGHALGRSEMKKIMAGSGSSGNCILRCDQYNDNCKSNPYCYHEVSDCTESTILKNCGIGQTNWVCVCS